MNQQEFDALVAKVGTEAAEKIKGIHTEYEAKFKSLSEGVVTIQKLNDFEATQKQAVQEVKSILEKQGTTMQEVLAKVNGTEGVYKSIGQVLAEDRDSLAEIYKRGVGYKEYMITLNEKGQFVMKPYDSIKAAGPVSASANVGGAGNVASIAQAIDSASLLRLGGAAPIVSQFRNTPWVFGLCNTVPTSVSEMFAMWYDETAPQGASATVTEGGSKPLAQYAYSLKSATYKKEAVMVGMSQEFSMDFERLQADIISKAETDLVNRINTAILPNITSAATAYNLGVSYAPVGGKVVAANEYDVIAAMAAQVENATFSPMANAAVVSTFKKYRMGTAKDSQNRWLDSPDILRNISIVSNPAQAALNVMVGDFKQYNILLRGGVIVKVGYNGTDFANNMFSTVIEQFYFDYISSIRAAAIVKGPDFPTVITALS